MGLKLKFQDSKPIFQETNVTIGLLTPRESSQFLEENLWLLILRTTVLSLVPWGNFYEGKRTWENSGCTPQIGIELVLNERFIEKCPFEADTKTKLQNLDLLALKSPKLKYETKR